jgi:hypothetical protein
MNRTIIDVMKLKQVNKDRTISVTLPEFIEYAEMLKGNPSRCRTFKFQGYRLKLSLGDQLRTKAMRWTRLFS